MSLHIITSFERAYSYSYHIVYLRRICRKNVKDIAQNRINILIAFQLRSNVQ